MNMSQRCTECRLLIMYVDVGTHDVFTSRIDKVCLGDPLLWFVGEAEKSVEEFVSGNS